MPDCNRRWLLEAGIYTDDDETLFDVERPSIITCIQEVVHRSDLADRGLQLGLPPISDEARRPLQAIRSEFEADHARLVGAVHEAVAGGLRMLPTVELTSLPRMADFAQWGEAVARGLGWEPGLFLDRYNDNRRVACASALDDCEVVQALGQMMKFTSGSWSGSASDLLELLNGHACRGVTRSGQWPRTARVLSQSLRQIAPQLRTTGMNVTFDRIENVRRITITQIPSAGHGSADSAAVTRPPAWLTGLFADSAQA